jgi:hypothetical protein
MRTAWSRVFFIMSTSGMPPLALPLIMYELRLARSSRRALMFGWRHVAGDDTGVPWIQGGAMARRRVYPTLLNGSRTRRSRRCGVGGRAGAGQGWDSCHPMAAPDRVDGYLRVVAPDGGQVSATQLASVHRQVMGDCLNRMRNEPHHPRLGAEVKSAQQRCVSSRSRSQGAPPDNEWSTK